MHYDSLNGGIVAHRATRGRPPELLWRNDARNFLQMMVWADTGELVVEDAGRIRGQRRLGARGPRHRDRGGARQGSLGWCEHGDVPMPVLRP